MFKTGNREADYLLELIACALNETEAPPAEQVQMDILLSLADKEQVYSMILPILEKTKQLSPAEKEKWNNYKLSDLQKTIIVNHEREQLCRQLDSRQIDYMFLKGVVLRQYYPQTAMRQMSDNDILYHEKDKQKLYKIMKAAGFRSIVDAATSDDFKKGLCAFDFHRQLFNEKDNFAFTLNLWERAERCENSAEWRINKEDNYLYCICHMYKHYVLKGCSIRFLSDLFLLRRKEVYDEAYLQEKLAEFHLTEFERTAVGAAEAAFGNKEANSSEAALLRHILFSTETTVEEKISRSGGKLPYILKRMFPPKQQMRESYTKLERYPFLFPYYYGKRLCMNIIYEKDALKKEFQRIRKSK